MQFRVVIPENVKSGQTIRIACPDGTEADVKVPKGLKSGESFIFEMSVDQLKNPQQMLDSLQEESNVGGTTRKGFLNRDIANTSDFLLALAVGLTIGMGIVVGFLAGILYATKDVSITTQTASKENFDQMPKMRSDY
jgi:hypothetical protein